MLLAKSIIQFGEIKIQETTFYQASYQSFQNLLLKLFPKDQNTIDFIISNIPLCCPSTENFNPNFSLRQLFRINSIMMRLILKIHSTKKNYRTLIDSVDTDKSGHSNS